MEKRKLMKLLSRCLSSVDRVQSLNLRPCLSTPNEMLEISEVTPRRIGSRVDSPYAFLSCLLLKEYIVKLGSSTNVCCALGLKKY